MTTDRETLSVRMARRLGLLRLVLDHPLNRDKRVRALGRWTSWQVWRHVVRRPITVRISGDVRVRVYPDWPYSWTAIYLRLAEYDDMMFTLRYLRPGDAFVDVGANVGYYSLLASAATGGSPVLAVEPHPVASQRLRENALLNSFENIRVRAVAAGRAPGTANLTADLVDQNRISAGADDSGPTITVSVVTLDAELVDQKINPEDVRLVKIDTEGFEANVLSGARGLLDTRPGPVWLVEMAGLGQRYGTEDQEIPDMFRDRGYQAFRYVAADNNLIKYDRLDRDPGNVLFARDPQSVLARVQHAAPRAMTRR